MLDDVRGEQAVERSRAGQRAGQELLGGVGLQPALPGHRDRRRVVVDADAPAAQVREVAAQPAADVEGATQPEPADVPAVGRLHVQQLLPAGLLQVLQAGGVVGRVGARGGASSAAVTRLQSDGPAGAGKPGPAGWKTPAVMRLEQTSIPGLLTIELDAARRRPRLVQGGLPAGQAGGPGLPAVRDRAEQRVVQRRGGRDPRDPRRAVGQVHLAGPRAGLRRDRRPARPAPTFGRVETIELHPGNAIFVPRGCGNSYQTLTPDVVYTYLVNEHWSPDARYTLVQAFDPALGIDWPIPERAGDPLGQGPRAPAAGPGRAAGGVRCGSWCSAPAGRSAGRWPRRCPTPPR